MNKIPASFLVPYAALLLSELLMVLALEMMLPYTHSNVLGTTAWLFLSCGLALAIMTWCIETRHDIVGDEEDARNSIVYATGAAIFALLAATTLVNFPDKMYIGILSGVTAVVFLFATAWTASRQPEGMFLNFLALMPLAPALHAYLLLSGMPLGKVRVFTLLVLAAQLIVSWLAWGLEPKPHEFTLKSRSTQS